MEHERRKQDHELIEDYWDREIRFVTKALEVATFQRSRIVNVDQLRMEVDHNNQTYPDNVIPLIIPIPPEDICA